MNDIHTSILVYLCWNKPFLFTGVTHQSRPAITIIATKDLLPTGIQVYISCNYIWMYAWKRSNRGIQIQDDWTLRLHYQIMWLHCRQRSSIPRCVSWCSSWMHMLWVWCSGSGSVLLALKKLNHYGKWQNSRRTFVCNYSLQNHLSSQQTIPIICNANSRFIPPDVHIVTLLCGTQLVFI